MTSAYCNAHPASSPCFINSNYDPFVLSPVNGGGSVITTAEVPAILNIPTMSTTPLIYPKNTPTTTLDKSITAGLSALALLLNRGSIPTAQQQQQGIDPLTLQLLANQQAGGVYSGGGSNTLGRVEAWVKNNTGVTAIIAGAAVLYFMQPSKPARR